VGYRHLRILAAHENRSLKREEQMDKRKESPILPSGQPRPWTPMTLVFVGNVGVVMQKKTGGATDPSEKTFA
jgi:hypothetical protein